MKLTWYGHSCFLIETEAGSLVFDPYAPGSVPGLSLPPLTADAVVCSHGHRDHGWAEGVTLSGRRPGFTLQSIPCFHDGEKGARRGENRITVLEAEGLRAAHLGDLGHMLSAEQLAALGRLDLLLIPVGGFYTIGAETAAALVKAAQPRICVPMHYRGEGFGYDVLGPVTEFTRYFDAVQQLDSNTLELRDAAAPVVVLRCPAV